MVNKIIENNFLIRKISSIHLFNLNNTRCIEILSEPTIHVNMSQHLNITLFDCFYSYQIVFQWRQRADCKMQQPWNCHCFRQEKKGHDRCLVVIRWRGSHHPNTPPTISELSLARLQIANLHPCFRQEDQSQPNQNGEPSEEIPNRLLECCGVPWYQQESERGERASLQEAFPGRAFAWR